VVLDPDENCVVTWKNLVEYFIEEGPDIGLHRDIVFANVTTGALVTVHPQIHGAASVMTYNCMGSTTCSYLVSESNAGISTGDVAIDSAHNFTLATYNYYLDNFNRSSIDGNGMALKSRVHYDNNYNNAYWDGSQMVRESQLFE
jgi:Zn-dependent metalloprotease